MAKKTPNKATVTPIKRRRVAARPVLVGVRVESHDADAMYSNYMEVSHSKYEFMLSVARVPTKLNASASAFAKEHGELVLEPQVQILFPPQLIAGLIKALEVQRDEYETHFGKINPMDGSDDDQ